MTRYSVTFRVRRLLPGLSALLSAFLFLSVKQLAADPLVSDKLRGAQIKLERTHSKKGSTLRLEVNAPSATDIAVFSLVGPNRIVLDLVGEKVGANKTYAIQSPVVKQLRVGSHQDKTRMVLDINSDVVPDYTWSQFPGGISIVITEGGEGEVADASDPTPAAVAAGEPTSAGQQPKVLSVKRTTISPPETNPTPTEEMSEIAKALEEVMVAASPIPPLPPEEPIEPAEIAESPAPAAKEHAVEISPTLASPTKAVPTAIPTAVPTVAAVEAVVTEAPPPASEAAPAEQDNEEPSAEQFLEGVSFDYLDPDRTPVIKITLSKRPLFNLVKKDPKFYRLNIPECAPKGKHVTLEHFPPHDFIGFTVIAPKQQGGDMEIAIGVDPGTRIASFARDNEIWIKALPGNPRPEPVKPAG